MHDYGAKKEDFGLVAINERANVVANPHAVMREPISMDDYLNARIIRWPLGLLDMDVPIDGADAVVVTTAERARHLVKKPVYVHAISSGRTEHPTVTGLEEPRVQRAARRRSNALEAEERHRADRRGPVLRCTTGSR